MRNLFDAVKICLWAIRNAVMRSDISVGVAVDKSFDDVILSGIVVADAGQGVAPQKSRPVVDDFMEEDDDSVMAYSQRNSEVYDAEDVWRGVPRLLFTLDSLRAFIMCSRILISVSPADDVVEVICDCLQGQSNTAGNERHATEKPKVRISSDVWLSFAANIADLVPSETIFAIITGSWYKEWAGLGYCQALIALYYIIRSYNYQLSKDSSQHEDSTLDSSVNDWGDVVFARIKYLQDYPGSFWRVRILQLLCGKELIVKYPARFKEPFAACMLSCLRDIDYRVRCAAAASLGDLFKVFPKSTTAIYKSLLGSATDWLMKEDGTCARTSRVLTTMLAVFNVALSSDMDAYIALRDMLFLATIPFLLDRNVPPVKSAREANLLARCGGAASIVLVKLLSYLSWTRSY